MASQSSRTPPPRRQDIPYDGTPEGLRKQIGLTAVPGVDARKGQNSYDQGKERTDHVHDDQVHRFIDRGQSRIYHVF